MKFILPTICFIFNVLIAEIYPLAQKPFLKGLDVSDGFSRGIFLIIVAEEELVEKLSDQGVGDFIYFKF